MNNELELDQKTIDELLATANKELSGLDSPPPEVAENQEAPAVEDATPVPDTISDPIDPIPDITKTVTETPSVKKYLTKKIILGLCILFSLVIVICGFVGYKMAKQTTATKSPLDKIIQQEITFEEKNFVASAGRGDKDIANAFLEAGMSVNAIRPIDGWTPLMAASFYKQTEIVKLLLDGQADLNLQDKYGKTALMQATAMGAEDIVILLLDHGANPNLQDNNGRTALTEAYFKKHAKIAELLKSLGAILPIQTNDVLKVPPLPESTSKKDAPPTSLSSPTADGTRLSVSKAGPIQVGMPLEEIQKKHPTLTISEKYLDGNKKTIATLYLKESTTPSVQLELSSGKLKLISTISVYDEQFSTDKNITVRSTVGDIRNQYTINDIRVIDNSLFLVVKSIKMLFELDLNKGSIPEEWLNTGNPNSIPSDTTLKRIVIY